MKLSSLRSAFTKASQHPAFQFVLDHAAKITAGGFIASDCLLSSVNFLNTGHILMDLTHPTPDELISAAGLSYITAGLVYGAADNFSMAKKITAGLSLVGAGATTVASVQMGSPELFGATLPIIFTSLSLMFENQVNRLSQGAASIKGWAGTTARFYMDYPVATSAIAQGVGMGFAVAAGINDPNQRILIAYGAIGFISNLTFAMTDNNVRKSLKFNPA